MLKGCVEEGFQSPVNNDMANSHMILTLPYLTWYISGFIKLFAPSYKKAICN